MSLYCWGFNFHGQVGDGTSTERHTPKKVAASGVWAGITDGAGHSCAVSTGKSLYCWGFNGYGQIGDNTVVDRHSPTRIA